MVLEEDGMPMNDPVSDEAEAILGTLTKIRRHVERLHKCAGCEAMHGELLKAIANWVNKDVDRKEQKNGFDDEWDV